MYLTNKSIPEFKNLPKEKRQDLWKRFNRKGYGHWQVWLSLFFMGLCTGIGTLTNRTIASSIDADFILKSSIGTGIGAGLGSLVFSQVMIENLRPYFREELDLPPLNLEGRKSNWRIYFWFSAIYFLLVLVGVLISPSELLQYFNILFYLIGMFGLWGFTYNRSIIFNSFWKIYLFPLILWDTWIWIIDYPEFYESMIHLTSFDRAVIYLFLILLQFPLYFALFMYAFRSPNLWNLHSE
ncbi:MAG: hypothetical protein VW455_11380 [Nitrospinota bacterium]